MKRIFIIICVLGITSISLYFIAKNGQEAAVPELKRTIVCPSPWNSKWSEPGDTTVAKNATAVYYLSSSKGNDSNDGRSPDTPWKTIQKVNATALLPGDAILFKRGDTWNEEISPSSSGTLTKPIIFGAYGKDGSRPILKNSDAYAVVINNKNFITLNNLDIRNCKYCIQILNSDSITLEYMNVGLNAEGSGIDIDKGSDRGIIQYSEINGGTEVQDERDMIRLMDGSNWNIHHNLIANFGHDGINLVGRIPKWHDVEAHVTKNDIHHNEFFTKLGYGRAFSTQGNGPGYASKNKFYNNYIHDVNVSIQIQGDYNEVYENTIVGVYKSPQKPDDEVFQAAGISLNDYIYSANNKIYNNIIAYTDGPGINANTSDKGNEIYNNFIYRAGQYRGSLASLYNIGLYIAEKGLKYGNISGAQKYTNNSIYSPDTDKTIIYRELHYQNVSPITVAEFNARNGQNGDDITKNSGQKFSLTSECKVGSVQP